MTAYLVNRDEAFIAAAYAVSVLKALADDEQSWSDETPAQYAQRHLDRMVTEEYIRVEVES